MAIEFAESAGKHGFSEADAFHAVSNARYYEPEFDEPSDDHSSIRPSLWIGPSLDPQAPLLEVMAEVIPPRTIRVFHVMGAREKFLARLDKEEDTP
ncbi:hypothetical protein H7I77_25350 [Mycolicibacterium novocastrense]|uniref:Uncharacterized protein n=1 Tax=Mycolicibacterium novocastrense TaxID=59813 RepID=A0AAW5SSX5_MYCNV|nr:MULTISPECIES: hypothetical protein [Mycolicibacterium]MCV7026637.1 hypothetical protein [Mycolicibacterium novocastrense]MDX1887509.1 hypothetical protein [Mycolicibacterium sp. 120270]GAT07609.1 hypothetical protein RMCN_0742 [Mycolicibacterium novocastrense]